MAKKAKNNPVIVTATLYAPGLEVVSGEVLSRDEGSITIRYKKPRSSKYAVQTVPLANVVYVYDNEGAVEVGFKSERVAQFSITGEASVNELGGVTITTEDGVVSEFNAGADVELHGEDPLEGEAEPKAKKADKKAKVAKVAKKAKDEDEDEDDDEDDDDWE